MRIIKTIMLLCLCSYANAQTEGLEKSMYNVQVGLLGIWVNHECKLGNEFALRTEIGFDGGIRGGDFVGKTIYGLTPSINVEPRWYYNIEKRAQNGKYTANNSASFLTVGVKYIPDLFVIGNQKDLHVANQLLIIPKWGIRRAISKSNFNYEVGIGIGRVYYIDSKMWDTAADLHLRLGYTL